MTLNNKCKMAGMSFYSYGDLIFTLINWLAKSLDNEMNERLSRVLINYKKKEIIEY